MKTSARIRIRKDYAANWLLFNPVLDDGELGAEVDTRSFKVGDGVTAWDALDYQLQGAQGVRGVRGDSFAVTVGGAIVLEKLMIAPTFPALVDGVIVCAPVAHGLADIPANVGVFVRCEIAGAGFIQGDVCQVGRGVAVAVDAVNVYASVQVSALVLHDKQTGAAVLVNSANWSLWVTVF